MAGTFNFDMSKFPKSYSGPGENLSGFLSSLAPQATSAFSGLPEKQQDYFQQARDDVNKGFDTAITDTGKTFKKTLHPALQNTLNNLSRKGMVNSSVAGNALSSTARSSMDDILRDQLQLRLGRQGALSGISQQEGANVFTYPQLLAQILGQDQYSESTQENVPQQTALGFLERLMG